MSIIPYEKNGQKCYRIRCISKSKVRKEADARGQKDLGAISHKEATRAHSELKRQVHSLRIERERNQITWKNLMDFWFQKDVMTCKNPTTTKIDNYNSLLMYTADWMSLPVDQLTEVSVETVFQDMTRAGLSYGRMKSVKSAINTICHWGVLNRHLPISFKSPAKGAKLRKVSSKKQPILNQNEIRIFLQKAKDFEHEYYPIWAAAFSTGCRSGELQALQWKDVDFERRIISVNKSYQPRFKIIKSTKTGEWRDFPINTQLETLLKELKLKTASSGFVFPRINSWRRSEAASVTRGFCRSIGLPEINFHATRACFAVSCLEHGLSVATTMRLGGWTQVKSFQCYIRLSSLDIKGATDKMNFIPSEARNATIHQFKTGEVSLLN